MSARLCLKHSKPFPCGKCRIENAQKPAQVPPVTVIPQHKADARPVPRTAITPEIRKKIKESLASAPGNEKAVVTQQVETSKGLETVHAQEDRVPDAESIAERTDATQEINTRLPAQPRRKPAKQPAYLKSVAHPVVASSDPDAPYGRDENGKPIRPMRSDQEIAADLREKSYLAPGDCPHGNNSEYCLLCGTTNYRTQPAAEPRSSPGLELIEEALRLQGMKKHIVINLDTFDYFPEILGITRRQLIGLLDLPVGVEQREVKKKVLKERSGIENTIAELAKAPGRIEELKILIDESEQLIESWSVRVMKLRRAKDDILDKPTREKYKREEKKKIEQHEQEKRELQKRLPHLDELKERLDTWGSRPEDYETVADTEEVVVTLWDKFELSKRYLEDRPDDSIERYLAVLSEYGVLRDESRRFRDFPVIDRWRYLENEIIFQAIRWGLVRPTEQTIKKYPVLDRSTSGRPERFHDDPENALIIKTGGASIGASIYSAGMTWSGRKRSLSDFDNPVEHGKRDSGSVVSAPGGEFYGEIDSGDFGEHE
jgi:hypothetical protein